ncbi:sodium/glutamate symporter [Anaerophilus nitritogenes]|uniref:sodium/glutamate symporter n=1 Tax=Anaerophilus nitritogenes TaxID=2498136 RepID=UPI00101CA356|nr:sodium/glutamate symporter [Anaerophilus nitritogenes]
MKTELLEGMLTLKVDMIATLAVAVSLLLIGYKIRNKATFFEKFCIPAPVIGGLLFAIIVLILRVWNIVTIQLDTTFQSPFMIGFFTTVGLGGSFRMLRKGGLILIIYWLLSGALASFQNIIGVVFAKLTGLHPMLGIMAGAVSMEGGHGAAAAFGPTAESMGYVGASTVALSAATFGLIAGGLIGGPIARYLIEKYNLKPEEADTLEIETYKQLAATGKKSEMSSHSIFVHIALITLCITIGSMISEWFSQVIDFVLPSYVGAMFIAVIFRNINDQIKLVNLDHYLIDTIGNISLGIFLSMALMNLKLWQLFDLAIPMFVILIMQVLFMIIFCVFICFRLLGKNFDAAIMSAGMAGHGLGATPNAIANMGSVTEKYGPSPRAFLIVPLVGAVLIDIVALPTIVWFMNLFQ